MRIFWGFLGVTVGVVIVWKTYPLVSALGRIEWAEKHLSGGFGGTYFLYKLIGLVLVVLSAMYMFGILDNFLGPLTSVFGGLKEGR